LADAALNKILEERAGGMARRVGESELRVVASDEAGNTTSQTVTVKR